MARFNDLFPDDIDTLDGFLAVPADRSALFTHPIGWGVKCPAEGCPSFHFSIREPSPGGDTECPVHHYRMGLIGTIHVRRDLAIYRFPTTS